MEEEMEVEPVVFEAYEVDTEYEFDAARYFDFSRVESVAEAREAELWFDSAKSYPPSPFVTKLFLMEDTLLETVNTSPKCRDTGKACDSFTSNGPRQQFCAVEAKNRGIFTNLLDGNVQKILTQQQGLTSGSTFYKHLSVDTLKGRTNHAAKLSLPRNSTLMKPTASQLAKQNQATKLSGSRFPKLLAKDSDRSFGNSSGVESHAIKKQRLDGGHSRKVAEDAQQTSLVHKMPKKVGTATVAKNASHARLKLTIPREPDLETAHRAQRIRTKTELENVTTRRFKARPLNRKILEAPSFPIPKKSTPKLPEFHEFHLKTSERALQNTSAILSSSSQCNYFDQLLYVSHVENERKIESGRSSTSDSLRMNALQNFKAPSLNKKIFLNNGDIGVSRNRKLEATLPMEFNFHSGKRIQQPPIELFSKLSLTSELQQTKELKMKLSQPTSMPMKGSKENRPAFCQSEYNKITQSMREKPPLVESKLNGGVADASLKWASH